MSKKVEGQGEISSKAMQSCGMGMSQSIPMQKCAIMQKQHNADVSHCSRISCWEKTYSPLYRDANAATIVKHCASAAHACLLSDETEHVYYTFCIYIIYVYCNIVQYMIIHIACLVL